MGMRRRVAAQLADHAGGSIGKGISGPIPRRRERDVMERRRPGRSEAAHGMQRSGKVGGGKARDRAQERRTSRLGFHEVPGEVDRIAPRPTVPDVADDHRPAASRRASIAAIWART